MNVDLWIEQKLDEQLEQHLEETSMTTKDWEELDLWMHETFGTELSEWTH